MSEIRKLISDIECCKGGWFKIEVNKDFPLTLMKEFEELEKQLQAHKDKEDKLREFVKSKQTQPANISNFMVESEMDYLLKILDGSDE